MSMAGTFSHYRPLIPQPRFDPMPSHLLPSEAALHWGAVWGVAPSLPCSAGLLLVFRGGQGGVGIVPRLGPPPPPPLPNPPWSLGAQWCGPPLGPRGGCAQHLRRLSLLWGVPAVPNPHSHKHADAGTPVQMDGACQPVRQKKKSCGGRQDSSHARLPQFHQPLCEHCCCCGPKDCLGFADLDIKDCCNSALNLQFVEHTIFCFEAA